MEGYYRQREEERTKAEHQTAQNLKIDSWKLNSNLLNKEKLENRRKPGKT